MVTALAFTASIALVLFVGLTANEEGVLARSPARQRR